MSHILKTYLGKSWFTVPLNAVDDILRDKRLGDLVLTI